MFGFRHKLTDLQMGGAGVGCTRGRGEDPASHSSNV